MWSFFLKSEIYTWVHTVYGTYKACCTAWLQQHTKKRHFRTLEDKSKALCFISQLQTDYLQLMETVITNKATDSSQTKISGEGCWDLGYGVSLPLALACAISESKCSSFIYYSICFTPLFLFLFSHTPFSLSPLGGAVFIFRSPAWLFNAHNRPLHRKHMFLWL